MNTRTTSLHTTDVGVVVEFTVKLTFHRPILAWNTIAGTILPSAVGLLISILSTAPAVV